MFQYKYESLFDIFESLNLILSHWLPFCSDSVLMIAEVFNQGGWALDCSPSDLTGFDRLLAADPTRLHPFLVSWLVAKAFIKDVGY